MGDLHALFDFTIPAALLPTVTTAGGVNGPVTITTTAGPVTASTPTPPSASVASVIPTITVASPITATVADGDIDLEVHC